MEKDGRLYYDPMNPKSVNAALKVVAMEAQLGGFKYGSDEINYKNGYKEGYEKGRTRGIIFGASGVVLGVLIAVFGKKKSKGDV